MTIIEAYNEVKKIPGRNVLLNCVETPDLWAFQFSEEELEPDDFLVGGCFDAVKKSTGDIMQLAVPYDMVALLGDNWEQVDISIFAK